MNCLALNVGEPSECIDTQYKDGVMSVWQAYMTHQFHVVERLCCSYVTRPFIIFRKTNPGPELNFLCGK